MLEGFVSGRTDFAVRFSKRTQLRNVFVYAGVQKTTAIRVLSFSNQFQPMYAIMIDNHHDLAGSGKNEISAGRVNIPSSIHLTLDQL